MLGRQAGRVWTADRDTLLHEMVHAWLGQQGRHTKHAGQPWRDASRCEHRKPAAWARTSLRRGRVRAGLIWASCSSSRFGLQTLVERADMHMPVLGGPSLCRRGVRRAVSGLSPRTWCAAVTAHAGAER
jgi:hypothetical protein